MRRREFVVDAKGALWSLSAWAAQPTIIPRVGYLDGAKGMPWLDGRLVYMPTTLTTVRFGGTLFESLNRIFANCGRGHRTIMWAIAVTFPMIVR